MKFYDNLNAEMKVIQLQTTAAKKKKCTIAFIKEKYFFIEFSFYAGLLKIFFTTGLMRS